MGKMCVELDAKCGGICSGNDTWNRQLSVCAQERGGVAGHF